MSDKKVVKFYKKRNGQHEKTKFNHTDYLTIRKWLITGSFHNSFFLNESFDKSKAHLLKKFINYAPDRIELLIDEAYPIKLNKSTFIYTLVLLSNGPFKAKRTFKNNFDRIIESPKDLYKFMELCKKERGFGKIIHEAIHQWFRHHDIHQLERMFVEERAGNNWKSQDVMRLIKPKPIDKKEQLLFKWIAKDSIDESEVEDYRNYFPLIVAYESMRTQEIFEEDVVDIIRDLRLKNNMIPGNVERTKDIIYEWLKPVDEINISSTYPYVPKNINKLDGNAPKLFAFYRKNKALIMLNIVTLLMAYSQMKNVAVSGEEMDFLDLSEELLLDKIKKTYNPSIHILDTSANMFNDEMKSIHTQPAIAASVMIGMSKNVFTLDGEKFHRKDARSILEAEGFVRTNSTPKYNKIFESIKDINENVMFVWTNNKTFPKDRFYQKFKLWKLENKKQMKLVFVNLSDTKFATRYPFMEIYGINKKTEKLLKLIKDGIV